MWNYENKGLYLKYDGISSAVICTLLWNCSDKWGIGWLKCIDSSIKIYDSWVYYNAIPLCFNKIPVFFGTACINSTQKLGMHDEQGLE